MHLSLQKESISVGLAAPNAKPKFETKGNMVFCVYAYYTKTFGNAKPTKPRVQ